jgi:hypothetical protein
MRNLVPPFGPATPYITISLIAFSFALETSVAVSEGRYDWLLLSGWLAFMFGLWLANGLPERLDYTLDRLVDRGALAITLERLGSFKNELETKIVRCWAPSGGLLIALAMFGAFAIGGQLHKLLLMLFEMLGGYIAGCYLGRMVYYGALGFLINKARIELRVIPGHPDAVAGLKPVGDYFLRQAMVVGVPAMFLAVWLVLIPLPYFLPLYQRWEVPYSGLLALAILFEVLSFVVPLRWFHREMFQQKRILLREADRLSVEIVEIQRNLAEGRPEDEMKALKELVEQKTGRHTLIEKVPTWPIDFKATRIFSIGNFVLLIPLVSEWTGLSKPWAEFIKGVLEKMSHH